MEMKNFFKDNGFGIICMAVCFGLGFVLGKRDSPAIDDRAECFRVNRAQRFD